jgi:ElaB/YqjD/DUF883 family membrane-anchored ribosome-binding protein
MTTSLRVELDDATGPGFDALQQRLDDLAKTADELSRRWADLSQPLGEEAGAAVESRLRTISNRMAKLADSVRGQSPRSDERTPAVAAEVHSPTGDSAPHPTRPESIDDRASDVSTHQREPPTNTSHDDEALEAMASRIAEAVSAALQRLVDRFEPRLGSNSRDSIGPETPSRSDIATNLDASLQRGTRAGAGGQAGVPVDDGVAVLATAVEQQSGGFIAAMRSRTAVVQRAIRTVETVANELLAVQQTVAGHAAALQQIEQSVAAGGDRMRSQRWGGR